MFHVKHPEANPEDIGRETRILVERWVAEHAVDTLDPLFGQRIERLASAIALWGSRMNLTAEPSDPAELAFHVLDSLVPLTLAAEPGGSVLRGIFAQDERVLDLGAGAGFPGLVLAAASPAQFVLADARRKRASFLTVTAAEMGLRNVQVQAAQLAPETVRSADKFAASDGFEVVVARAFARPAEFHRMAAAALRPRGMAILYANPGQGLAVESARSLGMGEVEALAYSVRRGGRGVDRVLAVWSKSEAPESS
jgi:16S rRNA (guanine527-N7)-methyltransferase